VREQERRGSANEKSAVETKVRAEENEKEKVDGQSSA